MATARCCPPKDGERLGPACGSALCSWSDPGLSRSKGASSSTRSVLRGFTHRPTHSPHRTGVSCQSTHSLLELKVALSGRSPVDSRASVKLGKRQMVTSWVVAKPGKQNAPTDRGVLSVVRATDLKHSQPRLLHQLQQRLRINPEEERQHGDGQQHHAARTLSPIDRGVVAANAGLD